MHEIQVNDGAFCLSMNSIIFKSPFMQMMLYFPFNPSVEILCS